MKRKIWAVQLKNDKLHKLGILHDAVAIVIMNKNKEILLTKRSKNKLGSGL